MRALKLVTVLLAVSGAAADPAAAQQHLRWDNYCTVGSLQFCASVELILTRNVQVRSDPWSNQLMTGTGFDIRVRNLQGALGTTPWVMYGIAFRDLWTDAPDQYVREMVAAFAPPPEYYGTASLRVYDPAYCASVFGVPCTQANVGLSEWDYMYSGPGRVGFQPDWWAYDIGHLLGCDELQSGRAAYVAVFQTCGDGWVGFEFGLPGNWRYDKASSLGWRGAGDAGLAECGISRGSPTGCVHVTPEPVTIVLLGTGLAGIGAAWRRRRKHTEA